MPFIVFGRMKSVESIDDTKPFTLMLAYGPFPTGILASEYTRDLSDEYVWNVAELHEPQPTDTSKARED